MLNAPPSPSPGPSTAPTPSVSVTPSPTVLPKTGAADGNVGWFVVAAVALVVVGIALMSLVGRVRRGHVH